MILNDILAVKIALFHGRHSICLNDIQFGFTFAEITITRLRTRSNVFLANIHKLISVCTTVLVEKSESVHEFVGDDALCEALAHLQRNRLVATRSTDVRRAAEQWRLLCSHSITTHPNAWLRLM
jgi:hypothetical protein